MFYITLNKLNFKLLSFLMVTAHIKTLIDKNIFFREFNNLIIRKTDSNISIGEGWRRAAFLK